jgi:hypothetical protein
MNGGAIGRSEALRALGLRPRASAGDVREAFRRLVFETHPDRRKGHEDEFARIREAYELLREGDPANAAAPVRPSLETRVTEVPEAMRAACRTLLEEGAAALEPPERGEGSREARDHVPHAIRRQGRQVAYLVPTPLAKGSNRVAVPVGDLLDPRRITSKLVRVNSARQGPGRVEVPDDVREELFPGTRSVSIEFGGE